MFKVNAAYILDSHMRSFLSTSISDFTCFEFTDVFMMTSMISYISHMWIVSDIWIQQYED